ncbi:MAG TPA: DNA polymerase domain-containing protein [Clostridiales bacterium]|nr:DNA polymerase domain-containing protein [Clostridiales bacterium]
MKKKSGSVQINGQNITISNMDKLLWKDKGITKLMYVEKLVGLSEYILPYSKDRLLTCICYPDGVEGKSFYRKNIPEHAPAFISTAIWNGNEYILLNDLETLVWLGNMAALEFHTSFEKEKGTGPDSLVFDLDPSSGQTFKDVAKAALIVHETLESLNIQSYVKTSGATGLQIYIYTAGKYTYDKARAINEFFAKYFCEKHPELFTIERMVQKRGNKLYFDYLQMWQGKTIICPYSSRATKSATVATPITWEELKQGAQPEDFTLENIKERLDKTGDLFLALQDPEKAVDLDFIADQV